MLKCEKEKKDITNIQNNNTSSDNVQNDNPLLQVQTDDSKESH